MRQNGHLLSIQILRAIAALVVVIGHAGQEMTALAMRSGASAPRLDWFNWGWGVDIFFVISGFIMIHTSADHFGKPGAAQEFVTRRLIRIVPLYWFMTTALIAGALVAPRLLNVPIGDFQHILASYLFLPDARPDGGVRPVVALGWTLNYEMFFYVFFALCMLLPLRRGLALLFVLFGLFLIAGQMGPWNNVRVDFWTSPLLAEFLFGVVLGLMARMGWKLSLPQAIGTAVTALAMVYVCGPALSIGDNLPEVLRSGIPAALLVGGGALGPDCPRKLSTRALAFLGDASFALYLAHPFIIRPMREVWSALAGVKLPLFAYLPVALAASCLAAIALHLLLEKPMTKWLSARRKRDAPLAGSSPAAA